MGGDVIQLDPSGRVRFIPCRIPVNQSLSDPVDLLGYMLKGIVMPAAFQGTTLSFQAAQVLNPDPSVHAQYPYQELFTSGGAAVTVTVGQGQYIAFVQADHEQMAGVRFLKVRAGTSGAPQTQAAERILLLAVAVALE